MYFAHSPQLIPISVNPHSTPHTGCACLCAFLTGPHHCLVCEQNRFGQVLHGLPSHQQQSREQLPQRQLWKLQRKDKDVHAHLQARVRPALRQLCSLPVSQAQWALPVVVPHNPGLHQAYVRDVVCVCMFVRVRACARVGGRCGCLCVCVCVRARVVHL